MDSMLSFRAEPSCHSERSAEGTEARNRNCPGRRTPLGETKRQTLITQIPLSRCARSQKKQKSFCCVCVICVRASARQRNLRLQLDLSRRQVPRPGRSRFLASVPSALRSE